MRQTFWRIFLPKRGVDCFGHTLPLARAYAFGWQGGFATRVNIESSNSLGPVPVWCRSAEESYPWSPSHD